MAALVVAMLWQWSALIKIDKPSSSRMALTKAMAARRPKKSLSPSEVPIIIGARVSAAASINPLSMAMSEMLKWGTAQRPASACDKISFKFGLALVIVLLV